MLTREQLSRNLGTNLERERFKLGYSQQDMAKALDMSLSSYKRLANGDTGKVDVYNVYKLSQLTGKMFYELCGESSDLFQTYDRMRSLSPTQLHFIESLVQFEFDFSRNLETVPSVSREDYTTMIIPSGNMHDGMVYDSCSLEKINISGYRKRYGNQIDCALLVTSDHMSPVYHANDILLIARHPIRDGDTGIFINKVTGLLYIRRLRQTDPWRLEPLTYYGQTFYIDSNNASEMSHWIIFGHVISKTRG